jgi:tol-pal system protein YbgF
MNIRRQKNFICIPVVLFLSAFASRVLSFNDGAPVSEQSVQTNPDKIDPKNINNKNMFMYQQMMDLQHELEDLRGLVERQNHELQEILNKYAQLERQVHDLTNASKQNTEIKLPIKNGTHGIQEINKSVRASDIGPIKCTEEKFYKDSVRLILEKQAYDQAMPRLEQFISIYPKSTYIPNAHYWLGCAFMKKQLFDKAYEHFAVVTVQYPNSGKASAAMLQMGNIMHSKGDFKKARFIYLELSQKYSTSTDAVSAEVRLKAMDI